MFIFVLFLMLFTAFCFAFGAHLEKGCYSIREETLYSDVCCVLLGPFSTRRICSRDAKRKQESGNVIG